MSYVMYGMEIIRVKNSYVRVKQYRISTADRYIRTCRLDKDKY